MPFRSLLPFLVFTIACSSNHRATDGSVQEDAGSDGASDSGSDSATSDAAQDAAAEGGLDAGAPPVGIYRGTCDGSGGVWLDATRFLSFDDESQTWRIFTAGTDGTAVQSADFGGALGVSDEADVEDATRIGNRVFAITSHGRNKNGELEADRYRFFAFDLGGAVPSETVTLVGSTATLLQAMLVQANYAVDDLSARDLLIDRSNLGDANDPDLAPKVNGTSIEGLTVLPDGNTLAIGFRNPQLTGNALVVTLTNPNAVLTGATPAFGRIIRMDLGGLGIRSMAYDAERNVVWIIAGPHDATSSPFRLYKWTGNHMDAPVQGPLITPPANSGGPEVILPITGSPYLRLLYDQGAVLYAGTECKDLSPSIQRFTDALVLAP